MILGSHLNTKVIIATLLVGRSVAPRPVPNREHPVDRVGSALEMAVDRIQIANFEQRQWRRST